MPLLEIKNLAVDFEMKNMTVHAVRNVSLTLEKGEIHCIVGESGCGKSVTSYAVMNLIEKPGRVINGEIIFSRPSAPVGREPTVGRGPTVGLNLVALSEEKMRNIRGKEISMIFQDPMNSLNPVYRCGDQIAEVLVTHKGMSKKDALAEAVRVLDLVRVPAALRRIMQYPHELSGGLRQRVMIAMAIICKPSLLIADEPTTALDVTVQRQILDLLNDLRKEMGMAILFITHDLGVVNLIADKVSVLYAGAVVEVANKNEIFTSPKHPYTVGLLNAVPKIGNGCHGGNGDRLQPIDGNLPDASKEIVGCAFEPRCPNKQEICKGNDCLRSEPPETKLKNHSFYCFNPC